MGISVFFSTLVFTIFDQRWCKYICITKLTFYSRMSEYWESTVLNWAELSLFDCPVNGKTSTLDLSTQSLSSIKWNEFFLSIKLKIVCMAKKSEINWKSSREKKNFHFPNWDWWTHARVRNFIWQKAWK